MATTVADELRRTVSSNPAAVIVIDLATMEVAAVSPAAAELLESTAGELKGMPAADLVPPDDPSVRFLPRVAEGELDGYQARRVLLTRKGAAVTADVFVQAVDVEGGGRWALATISPSPGSASPSIEIAAGSTVALLTTDADWHVEGVGPQVQHLLRHRPSFYVGMPLLRAVRAEDGPRLLIAIARAIGSETAVSTHTSWQHRAGHWVELRTLVTPLDDGQPPRLGLVLSGAIAPVPPAGEEALQSHLVRIAEEARAAGLLGDGGGRLDRDRLPELSARQHDVLQRLLRGDRVPTIAKDLYLSPSTVRNHLSAIFRAFGVTSQAELLERLRG